MYFLRVRHNVATGTIRPYDLHFNRLAGAPMPEVEANDTPATANPLPASGWVSGTITAVSPGESDFYSINLNAGDSVYLSLDMNPERDASVWNGRLGFGLFGNPPANQILLANDANAGAAGGRSRTPRRIFFTVQDRRHLLRLRRFDRRRRAGRERHLPPERGGASRDSDGMHDLHQHQRAADDPDRTWPGHLDAHRARAIRGSPTST